MSKRWGIPVWYFFHTFAEKITDELFLLKREECLSLISSICNSLPCPYCRSHAMDYIKKYKLEKIQSRQQLKDFMFRFHNNVNIRTKKKPMQYTILKQYEKVYTINAIKYLKQELFKTYHIANHFSGWIRNLLLEDLNKFFKENLSGFRP